MTRCAPAHQTAILFILLILNNLVASLVSLLSYPAPQFLEAYSS